MSFSKTTAKNNVKEVFFIPMFSSSSFTVSRLTFKLFVRSS